MSVDIKVLHNKGLRGGRGGRIDGGFSEALYRDGARGMVSAKFNSTAWALMAGWVMNAVSTAPPVPERAMMKAVAA